MTTPRRLRRGVCAAATVLFVAATPAGPVAAQDPPVGPPPEPTTAPTEPGDGDSIPGGLDLGDSVVVDENGVVRWNVDTETTDADVVDGSGDDAEPDTGTDPGADDGTGTGADADGTAEPGSSGDTGTESPDPVDDVTGEETGDGAAEETGEESGTESEESAASSAGERSPLLLGAIGAVALIVVALLAIRIRSRRKDDQLEVIEIPITPGGDEPFDPTFWQPAYDGAADAGAYRVGGAAYAQYEAAATGKAPEVVAEPSSARQRFASLRTSVVDMADKGLADSGRAKLIASRLEAAGSPMRPGEWLVMSIALTFVGFVLGMLFNGPIFAVIFAGGAAYLCWYWMAWKEKKRQRAFADALPETLQLLAGALRGGLSMMQAIQTVADEADEPTSGEFQRLMTEARLGRDLAASFRELSRRMDSKDFDWVVTAIEIHREVGGDLASILDRVGDTIRARNRVLGQVKALSAEGRMSGLILFMLPPGMLGAISVMNGAYLEEMMGSGSGQVMLVLSGLLLAIGGFWLKKLSEFVY